MSASLRWAGGYLIFSALVLAAGRHGWMVAAHVVLLFLLYRSIDAETIGWELVAEFGPMIIATAVAYAEVPTLVATVGGSYHDALAQHWELLLFHGQPARTLAGSLPSLPLSELLHGG